MYIIQTDFLKTLESSQVCKVTSAKHLEKKSHLFTHTQYVKTHYVVNPPAVILYNFLRL